MWSKVGDVTVAVCLNMCGWLVGEYTLGKSFLEWNYHSEQFNPSPQEYKWEVFKDIKSRLRQGFLEELRRGDYGKLDDLFIMNPNKIAQEKKGSRKGILFGRGVLWRLA